MKKTCVFILALLLGTIPVYSCLNDEKTLKNGLFVYGDYEGYVPRGHTFQPDSYYREALKEVDSLYKKTRDLDYLSDKGLLFILLKQYDKAIALYLDIEQREPGRYSTASNLGTAYELVGQNEKALKWIRRSIEIDSAAHDSSEWIHVRILEAKIKGNTFFTTRFLLGIDFGVDSLPITTLSVEELNSLGKALYFQLNERVSFIHDSDEIIARLMFDLSNIALLLGERAEAVEIYKRAEEYGFGGTLLTKRKGMALQLKTPKKNPDPVIQGRMDPLYLIYTGIALLLVVGMVVIYRRKRKKARAGYTD